MKNILIGVKMDKREVRNSLNQLQQTIQKIKMTQTADKKKKTLGWIVKYDSRRGDEARGVVTVKWA